MKPASLATMLKTTVAAGNRVWLFGNGGSFANAIHFAADLSSKNRTGGLMWPVCALGINQSLLTANSNDNGFDNSIALELRALASAGDLFLAISTSGQSPNVAKALEEALRRGIKACLLTGKRSSFDRIVGIRVIRVGAGRESDIEFSHAEYLSNVGQIINAQTFNSNRLARAVFLDRDGTLIPECVDGRQLHPERLLPGVAQMLRRLRQRGYLLILISNQSIVGHGRLSLRDHWRIHQRFVNALRSQAASLHDYYYCLHARNAGCECRKPKPGSLIKASGDWNIDLPGSYFIGNQTSDLQTAEAVQCKKVLMQFDESKRKWTVGHGPVDVLSQFS